MSLQSEAIADLDALELGLFNKHIKAAKDMAEGVSLDVKDAVIRTKRLIATGNREPISGKKLKARRDSARISAHRIETQKRVAKLEREALRNKRTQQAYNLRRKATPFARQAHKAGLRAKDELHKLGSSAVKAATRVAYKHPVAAIAGATGVAIGSAALARRQYKRSKNGEFAMSHQDEAIADLDALELGLAEVPGNAVRRVGHFGAAVGHAALGVPRAVVGAAKGYGRSWMHAAKTQLHHTKGMVSRGKTVGQRLKHAGGLAKSLVVTPPRIIGRTAAGAVKGYLNAGLSSTHHMQKALGNATHLRSGSKPMMLHNY